MHDPWAEAAGRAVPPVAHYSQARSVHLREGFLLFLAGQVAVDGSGAVVGLGDAAAQARQVYANIAAVLASRGGTFADVLRLTTFATPEVDLADAVQAREPYVEGVPPATTFTYVSALADPRFLLEVEAVAFVPAAAR
jgi:enamine deaminase RidA (YjgF/YER057c/UK114 family)